MNESTTISDQICSCLESSLLVSKQQTYLHSKSNNRKMELQNQQDHDDMPIPLNSTYGHVHPHMMMHHHHHPTISHIQQIPLPNGPIHIPDEHETASTTTTTTKSAPFKKMVRYKECLKNHAASMGGNATDGCGEFMPSGEEGTLEALVCSACKCHRNFHRKESEGENRGMGRKLMLGYHPMIMPYNVGPGAAAPSESDEQDGGGGVAAERPVVKKRFRTKFSQEQRNKMQSFAEKVGWKIQKQEESLVQQFCQEIGVKRRVLKVWIHNNKHNLAKKNHQSNAENQVLETNN